MTIYTWCNVAALRLEPGDLLRAVEAAQAGKLSQGGSPIAPFTPTKVAVCPVLLEPERAGQWGAKFRAMRRELTPDIEQLKGRGIAVVPGPGGLLGGEVWLFSPDDVNPQANCGAPLSLSAETTKQDKLIGNKIPGRGKPQPRGRKRVGVSEKELLALYREGLGVRAIAARLGVCPMLVSRRLAELNQEKLFES